MATQSASYHELETSTGYIVLSQWAEHGSWWHTVLYRHIWQESGGPNSEIFHVCTAQGDDGFGVFENTEHHLANLLEYAATQLQAAFERQL